jgi:hypothetical protein
MSREAQKTRVQIGRLRRDRCHDRAGALQPDVEEQPRPATVVWGACRAGTGRICPDPDAALLNVATHTAVLDVLRVVYRSPIIETLLIGAMLLQVAPAARWCPPRSSW